MRPEAGADRRRKDCGIGAGEAPRAIGPSRDRHGEGGRMVPGSECGSAAHGSPGRPGRDCPRQVGADIWAVWRGPRAERQEGLPREAPPRDTQASGARPGDPATIARDARHLLEMPATAGWPRAPPGDARRGRRIHPPSREAATIPARAGQRRSLSLRGDQRQ